jgi:hypothetical protein
VFEAPETRYAKSGDVNIAYQVAGDGPSPATMPGNTVSVIKTNDLAST